MTKIPLVLYEKDLAIGLLLCEKILYSLVFCDWLIKVAFFVGQILNPRIAFILGQREYFNKMERGSIAEPGGCWGLSPGRPPLAVSCL
jgi:hypothetical protein